METSNFDKLYLGEKEFTSSEYQKAVFKKVAHGTGNIVINASAGSAKTSTIENCLRFIPDGKKKLLLAFNKSIVQKLKDEVVKPDNVSIMTFHGLGVRILFENGVNIDEIDDYKYRRYVKTNLDEITVYKECDSLDANKAIYIENILELIDYARYYDAMRVIDIRKVADIYGIVPVRDEFDVVRKVLIWGKENLQTVDYTDLIWLPCVLNLTTSKYLFDFVFIDEAQDTTLAHQRLVDKTFRRGCRFVAVGDVRQQINVWCGATERALEEYQRRPNTENMNLTITYRCPKKIVELAKEFCPEIEPAPWAADGEILTNVSANDAKGGDLVLCRVMSKLVEQYMTYLRNNKKANLVGFDTARDSYLRLIDSVKAERIDVTCVTTTGLIPKLYKLYFDRLEEITKSLGIDIEDAVFHQDLLNLYDNIEALKVLSEGLSTVEELRNKVCTIFNEGEKENTITLSTIHKAKGTEADNVFILAPSLLPLPFATKEWEVQAEQNLCYVAFTRAKKKLLFIREDKRFNFFQIAYGNRSMAEELDLIKHKLEYVESVNKDPENVIPDLLSQTVQKEEPVKKKSKGAKKFGEMLNAVYICNAEEQDTNV